MLEKVMSIGAQITQSLVKLLNCLCEYVVVKLLNALINWRMIHVLNNIKLKYFAWIQKKKAWSAMERKKKKEGTWVDWCWMVECDSNAR